MSVIDIQKHKIFYSQLIDIRKRRYQAIIKKLKSGNRHEDYSDAIELWIYNQGTTEELLIILDNKRNCLESRKLREYLYTTKQIEQKTLYPNIDVNSWEYKNLVDKEFNILKNLINDKKLPELERVGYELELFYLKDEKHIISMQRERMSKAEADRLAEVNVHKFYDVIGILTKQLNLLIKQHESGKLDEIEDLKIQEQILKITNEIAAKREFVKQYRARKEIYQ